MRCNNCGWENPEGRVNCEKCNSELLGYSERHYSPVADEGFRQTINEGVPMGMPTVVDNLSSKVACGHCGYPLLDGISICPNCGNEKHEKIDNIKCFMCHHENIPDALFCSHCGSKLKEDKPNIPVITSYGRKTISPWEMQQLMPSCSLRMFPETNGEVVKKITFSDSQIILNRANTDLENMTITSKEQAVLAFEDGKWYIQDRSEHKTTFIYTSEQVELKKGDIIVMGNRRFEFDE